MQIGHNAAGIIPDGMTLDFPTIADGDPKAFELMMDWCERTESKVILGATLTSQADRGSNTNALGNVHNEVRKELKDSDAKQVAATLSRDLVYPIAVLNGLAPDGYLRCPRLKLDIAESKDITVFAEALPKLVGMGMRINRGWAHTELGIPQADANDKDVLVPLQEAAPPTPQPSRVAAATSAVARPAAAPADREDQLTVLLQRQADPAIRDMVYQVKALVDASESLDALLAGLSELHTAMSVDALTAAMGEALAVAGIAGMSDAWDDADG